ncbi:MAG: hypothetical protein HYZ92_05725 [Candidatus Omnitrophica bacterium]|nr:hypothetical protein [Candidatus Omnitrophota bacterium]
MRRMRRRHRRASQRRDRRLTPWAWVGFAVVVLLLGRVMVGLVHRLGRPRYANPYLRRIAPVLKASPHHFESYPMPRSHEDRG